MVKSVEIVMDGSAQSLEGYCDECFYAGVTAGLDNTGIIKVGGADGQDLSLAAGDAVDILRENLQHTYVKGSAPDTVELIAFTGSV
jgi:hypothetical protein